jgi:homogentisate 1,2-dioxygenase
MTSAAGTGTDTDSPQLQYLHGYGNQFESEAYAGALPHGRNNPRVVPHGLYTEKLSGTAFTAPRQENRQTWLYRIQPSVCGTSHSFRPCGGGGGDDYNENGGDSDKGKGDAIILPKIFGRADWIKDMKLDPNPMRWGATPLAASSSAAATAEEGDGDNQKINFIQGINTLLGSGDPTIKSGLAIYVYACNADMSSSSSSPSSSGTRRSEDNNKKEDPWEDNNIMEQDIHMYNSDGDFLIVPQQRTLWVQTELGRMTVMPGEICILPRGIVFTVNILNCCKEQKNDDHDDDNTNNGSDGDSSLFARGYILEIFRGHFNLPELGVIGSSGLANARDFLHPTAYYESSRTIANKACTIVNKFGQHLFARANPHSPYNVVAWHGNYLPCKYDLRRFCAINSVTYDHPDPSIYTVLTAKGGDEDGTALADFVIFPPRIMATGMLPRYMLLIRHFLPFKRESLTHNFILHPSS